MLTIKCYLEDSGSVARMEKNFPLYQGQFQNILLSVFVPLSLLAPNFTATADGTMQTPEMPYVAGTAVKIGCIKVKRNGVIYTSQSYFMRYLKTVTTTVNGKATSYALFERKLPKEFTYYAGTGEFGSEMVINVVNVDTEATPATIIGLITSQKVTYDVLESSTLDNDQTIEADDLTTLNGEITAINQSLEKKQDKADPSLSIPENLAPQDRTVVGAINDLQTRQGAEDGRIGTLETNVSELQSDMTDVKNIVGNGQTYVGTMTVQDAVPTTDELNAFVEEKKSRSPDGGDTIIVIVQLEDETDTNYKFIYNGTEWGEFPIPPVELAKNGTAGLVSGTYSVGKNYNTLVDIVDGEIRQIYVKLPMTGMPFATYYPLDQAIATNKTDIANIKNGTTTVGLALKAISDSLGQNIVDTYLTQADGATKLYVKNYALPKEFNEVYYFNIQNGERVYNTTVGNVVYGVSSASVGSLILAQPKLTLGDVTFELSRKNQYANRFYIGTTVNGDYQFRLTTKILPVSGTEIIANVELTTPITLNDQSPSVVEFNSPLSYLNDQVIKLGEGDQIQQILEVITTSSTPTNFLVYSNATYPSTFNLGVMSQIIHLTQDAVKGEYPVYTATVTSLTGSPTSIVSLKLDVNSTELINNTVCYIRFNATLINFTRNTMFLFKTADDVDVSIYGGVNLLTYWAVTQANIQTGDNSYKYSFLATCRINNNRIIFNVVMDNIGDITQQLMNIHSQLSELPYSWERAVQLGANGVIESNRVVFTVESGASLQEYRNNLQQFLMTLHLPVVGAIDPTLPLAITYGDTTYQVFDMLTGGQTPVTIGDLVSVDLLDENTGHYYNCRMIFLNNSDYVGFCIVPPIVTAQQVASLVAMGDEITAMKDGNKVKFMLAQAVRNDLSRALKKPVSAPATTTLVAIGTDNQQKQIGVGTGLSLANDTLSATGGVYIRAFKGVQASYQAIRVVNTISGAIDVYKTTSSTKVGTLPTAGNADITSLLPSTSDANGTTYIFANQNKNGYLPQLTLQGYIGSGSGWQDITTMTVVGVIKLNAYNWLFIGGTY